MEVPRGSNNALKRRRLDEEPQPRPQEIGSLTLTAGYQAGYESSTAPTAAQHSYSGSVAQWVSATPQPDVWATGNLNSTLPSPTNNQWNPYHSFPSQSGAGIVFQGNSYPLVANNAQPPSTAFTSWSSAPLRYPMPQEPAQNYPLIFPTPLCPQYPMNPTQVPLSLQPWQSAVCMEAQLDVDTMVVPNHSLPTALTPAQQAPEEKGPEKVCFGMVS